MGKKILVLGITIMMLFSLVACNSLKEGDMNIPFELSDKTTNYFDMEEKENILKVVKSLEELTQLICEKNFDISPKYEGTFFDDGALVLYGLTHPANWRQYSIDKITIEGDKLFLHQILYAPKDASGALIGVGVNASSFFLIEVNKADIADVVELEIKTTIK